MAVSTTDLVSEIRSTSDLQQSRFCTDDELLRFANDVTSELYDVLVAEREGYFQASVVLVLDTGPPTQNSANLPDGSGADPSFYKEIGLQAGTEQNPIDILPLESFNDRFVCCGPRYWIASRLITVYPTNVALPTPVTLTYVPECPVYALGDLIPVDMERFREYIAVGASIKVKAKRKQDSADLQQRLLQLRQRAINMATGRKAGPRVPAMPRSEQRGYGHWNRVGYRYPYWS